jgi:DNA-binding NarL/FixJ family response regulator
MKPLTDQQARVAEGIGNGWRYKVVAAWLEITEDTVAEHVCAIVKKVGNPDNLDPRDVVFLYDRHRRWLLRQANDTAA